MAPQAMLVNGASSIHGLNGIHNLNGVHSNGVNGTKGFNITNGHHNHQHHDAEIEAETESYVSPQYARYQREATMGVAQGTLPQFSLQMDELADSMKSVMGDKAYAFANGVAGLGWTDRANREEFYRWRIRPRAMVNTDTRDLSVNLFGHRIPAPILFAPIGVNNLYHPDGETVAAKVAGELGLPYCMSTASAYTIEKVAESNDLGAAVRNTSAPPVNGHTAHKAQSPRFFQLYMSNSEEAALGWLERAWNSGFDVCIFTIDTVQFGWRPTAFKPGALKLANGDPIDPTLWHGVSHTWERIPWLIKQWKRISGGRPFVLKGITDAEDALTALEMGCDGIIVSNHAGRQVDGAVGTLEVLPEIVDAVGDKMTILFDSGIRTGSDVFKALALGAHAVLVGRLYIWGLAHSGEDGVRHVMKALLGDLDMTMTVAGYQSLAKLNRRALKYNASGIPPK